MAGADEALAKGESRQGKGRNGKMHKYHLDIFVEGEKTNEELAKILIEAAKEIKEGMKSGDIECYNEEFECYEDSKDYWMFFAR